jgi:hypothetical protein
VTPTVVLGWHSTRPPFAQVDSISVHLPASGTVFRHRPGEPPVRLTDPLSTELSVQHRLEPDQAAELVTAYQQGITVRELAARYLINRTTVLGHLRRQGVPKRHLEPVADGDADRAVQRWSVDRRCRAGAARRADDRAAGPQEGRRRTAAARADEEAGPAFAIVNARRATLGGSAPPDRQRSGARRLAPSMILGGARLGGV